MTYNYCIAAAGVAALFAASAATAQTATASAAFGNFQYALIDLTPGDGEAPWISFSGTREYVYAALYDGPRYGGALVGIVDAREYSEVNLAAGENRLSGFLRPGAVSAAMRTFDKGGEANMKEDVSFSLSANTRVVFSGLASVSASFNPGVTEGTAFAGMEGWFTADPADAPLRWDSALSWSEGPEQMPMSVEADSLAGVATGTIAFYANVVTQGPVPPVPEPGMAAMLLGGAGMLAAIGRRRSRRDARAVAS